MDVREPPASYAEYCRLPEDAARYEILQGVAHLTPSPGSDHQEILANLGVPLRQYVRAKDLGKVYFAPLDVILSDNNVVQPDLLFVARERLGIIKPKGVFGPPDLVVEIVSPASVERDLRQKPVLYREHGVREYWVVDPIGRAVDVWMSGIEPLDRHLVVTGDGTVSGTVLPGFSIPLADVFGGIGEIAQD